jgi:hypothetical protein
MRRDIKKFSAVLLFTSACISCAPEQQEKPGLPAGPPIAFDRALAYQVVQREDISSRSRNRLRAFIYSPAESVEARIETSMKAAFELQQSTGCDYVKVFHLIAPDPNQTGTATYYVDLSYAPDGLGVDGESPLRNRTWEAMATDQIVDSLTLKVENLWWSNRDRFQRDNGYGGKETDEKALKEFIAKQLNVESKAVKLATLYLSPYP